MTADTRPPLRRDREATKRERLARQAADADAARWSRLAAPRRDLTVTALPDPVGVAASLARHLLDALPADPILARSRFALSAVAIPEEVRLRVFREVAEDRGLADALPAPPFTRTPEEVAASRRRHAHLEGSP